MYGDSQALSSDAGGSIYPLASEAKEDLIAKSRELLMDSDTSYREYKQYYTNQNNSGLLRFRSAPSSLLADFTDGADKSAKNSAETHGLTSRFSSSGVHSNQFFHGLKVLEDNKAMVNNGYASNSQLPPQYPRPSASAQLGSINGGYRVQNPMGVDHQGMVKMGSNLVRQNSSPAGLFSHLTAQNEHSKRRWLSRPLNEVHVPSNFGYERKRGVSGYAFSNGTSRDLSPSSNRLKSQMDFSSRMPSSLGMLSRISEVENETGGTSVPNDEKLGNGNGDAQFYGSDFPFGPWSSSSNYAENFSGLKREIDTHQGLFPDNQGGEPRNRPPMLSDHLSLPKTSAEIAAVEKLLQFQDTVPCKIRAKRGFATHPRSIAERVRRTRISERMRKLQELVPNMDRQTNTADMLDLAVDYVKDLQKQYKTLSDIRANCKCSTTQKSHSDQMF